jgi:hypothetical protein
VSPGQGFWARHHWLLRSSAAAQMVKRMVNFIWGSFMSADGMLRANSTERKKLDPKFTLDQGKDLFVRFVSIDTGKLRPEIINA